MNQGSIEYTVSVETQASIDAAENVNKSLDRTEKQMRDTDRAAGELNTGLSKLAKGLAAVALGAMVKELALSVQGYKEMGERVQMATDSVEEFEMVQKRLLETANGTYRSLSEAQEIYINTSSSIRGLGYSTSQALDIVDSLSYAFVTNVTSSQKAESAINALTIATNTNKVTSMQWITLMNAVPTVVDDIAKASGKTSQQVRELGSSGKLAAKDLTEGLRQSLDANKKASDGMANNFIDAGVRINNAVVSVLAGLEDQTGALQGVTEGIIDAANAISLFAEDNEKLVSLLNAAEIAGASFAAVVAARIIVSLQASAVGFYENVIAANAAAQSNLKAAVTADALARSELAVALATQKAAIGLSTHAAATNTVTAATARATAATTALAAAQTAVNSVMTVGARLAGVLRSGYALIGGPAGVALLAAVAIYQLAKDTKLAGSAFSDMEKPLNAVVEGFQKLGTAAKTLELSKLAGDVANLDAEVDHLARITLSEMNDKIVGAFGIFNKATKDQLPAIQSVQDAMRGMLAGAVPDFNKLAETIENTTGVTREFKDELLGSVAAMQAAHNASTELKERQDALIEANKKQTESKKESNTATGTGTDKTKKLTAAQREAARAAKKLADAQQANIDTVNDLQEALSQAGMEAEELAMRQAELSLNEYATPEQIARVRELARQLEEVNRFNELSDKAATLGKEDSITDKFAQEQAELLEMHQLKIITDEEYAEHKMVLERGMHDDLMVLAEERFRSQSTMNDLLISSLDSIGSHATDAFMDFATGAKTGKDAALAMAQAIGQSVVRAVVDMGVQMAVNAVKEKIFAAQSVATAATTGAAITAAYAPAAATASIATMGGAAAAGSTSMLASMGAMIAGALSFGGGRQYGGGVDGNSFYRVNEGGKPEIFNGSDGHQYMMPNQRGEVVSNKNASGGGITIHAPITVEAVDGMSDQEARKQGELMGDALTQRIKTVMGQEMAAGGMLWQG